jgi:hypothetical protein
VFAENVNMALIDLVHEHCRAEHLEGSVSYPQRSYYLRVDYIQMSYRKVLLIKVSKP